MDYYNPDISPYVYYFNSFSQLKAMLTSDTVLDTKNVRENAPKAYKKLVARMLHGWADLFGEMGYNVTVDGEKHVPGSGVEVTTARLYDAAAPPPKEEGEWDEAFRRLNEWQGRERMKRIARAREIRAAMSDFELDAYTTSLERKHPQRTQFAMLHDRYASIDAALVKLLDFANGERGKAAADVFGGSLADDADALDVGPSMLETADMALSLPQSAQIGPSNYAAVAKLHRVFALTNRLFTRDHDSSLSASETMLLESLPHETKLKLQAQMKPLAKILYPWAFSNRFMGMSDLIGSFKQERGIVLSFGNAGFEQGLLTIQHLRKNLDCQLPIEVFYNGLQDLDTEKIDALDALKGVTARNLQDVFTGIAEDRNFHSKPYAILASSFKKVFYIDDDVILFQSPDKVMSESAIFKQYGTLFFRGRTFEFGNSQWTRWFIKSPSVVANKTGRYFRNLSKDEMDASLMLFDKGRLTVVHGLLTTCHLNLREVREGGLDKHLQGDKETYWLSLELLRVPYKFAPGIGGAAGSLQEKNGNLVPTSVCGPQSHLDEFGKLLHVNSRSARYNNELDKWEKSLSHYISPTSIEPGNIDSTVQPWCVFGNSTAEVFRVSKSEKELMLKLREIEMEMRHESWKHFLENHI
ncbi:mannosyltransferase putative-domain-containing protein [Chytriomyces sp. MP71]|nr:mannosyltransferase putative-domain-containing protein [Chytriomyces sp. MP71]